MCPNLILIFFSIRKLHGEWDEGFMIRFVEVLNLHTYYNACGRLLY